MSTNQQLKKNLKLTENLMEYLADNPSDSPSLKWGAVSFVIWSKDDSKLNNLNTKLIESLQEEGKKVVKAIQTQDKNEPWTFAQV